VARVSVIVLNWKRPHLLPRTLQGLRQQNIDPFEVIVVSDRPKPADQKDVAWVQVSEANVSAARNAGLAAAGGDFIAFMDDDAVPERGWLRQLCANMQHGMGAVGGPVLGPNGWREQWGRVDVDDFGLDVPAATGLCAKLSGTNMMLTRSALEDVGRFDARLRYFHDDTDMVLRLCKRGWAIGWAADAVVHHGYAPSPRRRRFGVPRQLSDIGRSSAVLLATHCPEEDPAPILAKVRARERRRLLRLHLLGLLRGSEISQRLREFDRGATTPVGTQPNLTVPPRPDFEPNFLLEQHRTNVVVVPTLLTRRKAQRDATALRQAGHDATVIEMRYSPRRLTAWFDEAGVWQHLGGTLRIGPTADRLPVRVGRAALDEIARVQGIRNFSHVLGYGLNGHRRWWDLGKAPLTPNLFSQAQTLGPYDF
jgi:GT2 family glycosyltransferase